MNYFVDADFNKLWKPVTSEYKRFTLSFPTDEELIAHEKRLGVKLPASYIELAKASQNGGLLKRNGVPIRDEPSNVIRYVKINHISPIGHIEPEYTYLNQICDYPSLLYNIPNLVVIGENWDADYEFFVLNYRNSGADGEPTVEFITRKSKPVPFDFAVVKKPLKQAAQEAFWQIVKTYGREEIISFGLYVDDEGTMVAGAANTKSHLDELVAKDPSQKEYHLPILLNVDISNGVLSMSKAKKIRASLQ